MLNLTVAHFSAYDYDDTDAESKQVFIDVREVAGEPGTYRVTAEGYYSVTGAYAHIYYDESVNVDNYNTSYDAMCALFDHVDAALCKSLGHFDVAYDLYDEEGTRWLPLRGIGRNIFADALIREGVDCYPLTDKDLRNIAIA